MFGDVVIQIFNFSYIFLDMVLASEMEGSFSYIIEYIVN